MPVDVIAVLMNSEDDFNPKSSSGFRVRGLFYRLLKESDPGLASRIHDYKGLAPFSVSPLLKIYSNTYYFRIMSFLTRITKAILESLKRRDEIEFMNRRLIMREIEFSRIDSNKLLKEAEEIRR